MWGHIKAFFGRLFGGRAPEPSLPDQEREIHPDNVEDDDPIVRMLVSRAFNTKGMVIGNIGPDGKLQVDEIPLPSRPTLRDEEDE